MSWKISKFTSSLMGLIGLLPESAREASVETRTDRIRQAMLDCLSGLKLSRDLQRVRGRVLYASDPMVLWYLRGDLMTLLCGTRGEVIARRELAHITDLFQGLLPRAMVPRAGPTRYTAEIPAGQAMPSGR
jgi:hypothetical protein